MTRILLVLALWLISTHAYAVTFVFGDDVDPKTRAFFEETVPNISAYFQGVVGSPVPARTRIYASSNPTFLARQYMKHKGFRGSISKWSNIWGTQREAEGGFGGIFVRTNSKGFTSGYGSTVPNQRRRVLAHELFHVLQYELVGRKSHHCCPDNEVAVVGPMWMVEGAAQYIMHRYHFQQTGQSINGWANWAASQRKAYSGSLSDFETRRGISRHPNAYEISALAVHRLTQKTGMRPLAHFWSQLGKGRRWTAAFSDAFGVTPKEFYKSF